MNDWLRTRPVQHPLLGATVHELILDAPFAAVFSHADQSRLLHLLQLAAQAPKIPSPPAK